MPPKQCCSRQGSRVALEVIVSFLNSHEKTTRRPALRRSSCVCKIQDQAWSEFSSCSCVVPALLNSLKLSRWTLPLRRQPCTTRTRMDLPLPGGIVHQVNVADIAGFFTLRRVFICCLHLATCMSLIV